GQFCLSESNLALARLSGRSGSARAGTLQKGCLMNWARNLRHCLPVYFLAALLIASGAGVVMWRSLAASPLPGARTALISASSTGDLSQLKQILGERKDEISADDL